MIKKDPHLNSGFITNQLDDSEKNHLTFLDLSCHFPQPRMTFPFYSDILATEGMNQFLLPPTVTTQIYYLAVLEVRSLKWESPG